MIIFDNKLIELHRDFAAENLHKSDFLLQFATDDIIDHIKQQELSVKGDVIEHGARTGFLSLFLIEEGLHSIATEPSQKMLDINATRTKKHLSLDELPFRDDSANLILSCMNLHLVNDVRGFLKDIFKILKSGGTFIANFIGDGSFANLKKLLISAESEAKRPHYMHVMPLIPAENIYRLVQEAGFNFIVVDRQVLKLEYDDPINLMKDLKNMGENNSLASNIAPLPRSIFNYKGQFEDEVILVTLVVKKG